MQTPGLPDLWVVLPAGPLGTFSRSLWFECKAAGGQLSLEQREFRNYCLATGVTHVVGGLDHAIDFLRNAGRLK